VNDHRLKPVASSNGCKPVIVDHSVD